MDFDFLKNNPSLQNISPEKLDFLMSFAQQNHAPDNQSMASSVMNAAGEAKNQGIQFSTSERELLINLLKQNMSKEEQQKVDKMMTLMQLMQRRQ
ncbi:MAG: hypothetical protein IJ567_10450 [Lachnospiraceae bacterium]|nr:hypothetical protein [Lachnospiraceae bacterium]